jgi:phosphoketolase
METWASTSLRHVNEGHEGGPVCRKAGRASALVRVRRGAGQSDLIVACVVGDGEAETGALGTTKWASSI